MECGFCNGVDEHVEQIEMKEEEHKNKWHGQMRFRRNHLLLEKWITVGFFDFIKNQLILFYIISTVYVLFQKER